MCRIALLIIGAILSATVNAQSFTAVKIEAEDFISKNSDWRVTTRNNTPNVNPDPDGSHAASASGGAYMELLPDTRVTHSDPLITGRNFWNAAGTGPELNYNVNIPEAGRYLVFVKAYSTGTEDNGIHVGLNNTNPASGERMQWCGGKNQWTWSSAQRTSSNHCGVERTIFLNFSFAGANTVTFTAREDGFEFDQFILLKTNDNSCRPNNNDQIACNSGTSSVNTQSSNNTPAPAPEVVEAPAPVEEPVVVEAPAPVETPVVVQTPVEAPAPVVAPVSVTPEVVAVTATPTCLSSDSDPDGDGWGWENNQSCRVEVAATETSSATGIPVCASAASDPDGDGWGWENNQSCQVEASAAASAAPTATPACASADSDPDGDGWGWENNQSCLVQ